MVVYRLVSHCTEKRYFIGLFDGPGLKRPALYLAVLRSPVAIPVAIVAEPF